MADRPRADGRGQPRDGGARLLGAPLRRPRLHDHHRVGHRHALGQHPDRRPGRPARARAAPPDPRPGRAGAASGPTPTSSIRPTACSPNRPTSGCARSASTPSWGRGSRSPCATSRSGGRATCSGSDQSGHIAAVGYDLYVQLVAEAVAEARGRRGPTPPTVSIDVPGDAHLPKDYVAAEDARLEAYRRLAVGVDRADVEDIGAEWADRYGPLPGARRGAARPGPPARRRPGAGHRRGRDELGATRRDRSPWCACRRSRCRPARRSGSGGSCPGATYREDLAQLLVPIARRRAGRRRRAPGARRAACPPRPIRIATRDSL